MTKKKRPDESDTVRRLQKDLAQLNRELREVNEAESVALNHAKTCRANLLPRIESVAKELEEAKT